MLKLETLTSIILAISETIFKIFVPCSEFPKFFRTTPTFATRMSRSRQNNSQLWDTLYQNCQKILFKKENMDEKMLVHAFF